MYPELVVAAYAAAGLMARITSRPMVVSLAEIFAQKLGGFGVAPVMECIMHFMNGKTVSSVGEAYLVSAEEAGRKVVRLVAATADGSYIWPVVRSTSIGPSIGSMGITAPDVIALLGAGVRASDQALLGLALTNPRYNGEDALDARRAAVTFFAAHSSFHQASGSWWWNGVSRSEGNACALVAQALALLADVPEFRLEGRPAAVSNAATSRPAAAAAFAAVASAAESTASTEVELV